MKALVLAGGFAERLRPLTDRIAKPLLPIGDRPMIEWICASIEKAAICDEVFVATNALHVDAFHDWADRRTGSPIWVLNDGATHAANRLGAIGEIHFALSEIGPVDELLVVAGDNLTDLEIGDFLAFARAHPEGSVVALHQLPRGKDARRFGVVETDERGRITSFVEKPDMPRTQLIATAIYVFAGEHLRLIDQYLSEGGSPDHSGSFVAWLAERDRVFGYEFGGRWLDIGDIDCLLEADNLMRARCGLRMRAEYALSDGDQQAANQ